MTKLFWRVLWLLMFAGVGYAGENQSPFPALDELREPILLPPHPQVTVDKDGNWIVNGKMRYILGTQVPSLFGRKVYQPIPGADPQYDWFATKAPDYEICQRMGFDLLCTENPMRYLKEKFPAFKYDLLERSSDGFAFDANLPILMDYTCAPWSNGRPANRKGEESYHPEIDGQLPIEAIVPKTQQIWMPYSMFHPAGQAMYVAMWESGAKIAKEKNGNVINYEFFNEPCYNDQTPYARAQFAELLSRKYGTPDKMNQAWNTNFKSFQEASQANINSNTGLFVDYINFLEDGIVNVCSLGKAAIRKIDPQARFSYQIKGYHHYRRINRSANNMYKINKLCEVISLPTGGGVRAVNGYKVPIAPVVEAPANPLTLPDGIMARHFFRALADGKPLSNQEMYVGKDYNAILSNLWLDYIRGTQLSIVFNWASGIQFWKKKGIEGGKKEAEKAGYTMLNPYAVPPQNLAAMMQAKKEILKFAEYFLPREKNVNREVAVLFSYPTEHASNVNGNLIKNDFVTYGGALDFSHYPIDVLFEEQLAENRQERYRAIVAAGVRNTYAATVPALRAFAEKGGTVILGREFMTENEHGLPVDNWQGLFDGMKYTDDVNAPLGKAAIKGLKQPDNLRGTLPARVTRKISAAPGWNTVADDGRFPVILQRPLGKGKIYLLTADMPDYALASALGSILRHEGIAPAAVLRRPENGELPTNIELHSARRGNETAYFMYNYDLFAKKITIESDAFGGDVIFVDLTGKKSLPVKDGRGTLLLPPQIRAVFAVGPQKTLTEKYGPFTPATEAEFDAELAKLQKIEQEKARALALAQFSYNPSPAHTYTVNLRDLVNSNYVDSTAAKDGAGGWTDQGPGNGLLGVPWGMETFLGVPCDLIRPDENSYRSCIILKGTSSKIAFPETATIPLNDRLKALYFFHAVAWAPYPPDKKVAAFEYVVNYTSGKKLTVPVTTGKNVTDWYNVDNKLGLPQLTAWKNRDGNGFICWRWENPQPDEQIQSVTMRSLNNEMSPILIALTAEKHAAESAAVTFKGTTPRSYPHGGYLRTDCPEFWGVKAGMTLSPYAGFVITSAKPWFPADLPDTGKGELRFRVRGGLDKFSGRGEGQKFLICLLNSSSKGVQHFIGPRIPLTRYVPTKKITAVWQEAAVPVAELLPNGIPENGVNQIGFRYDHAEPASGLELKDIRFVFPASATGK